MTTPHHRYIAGACAVLALAVSGFAQTVTGSKGEFSGRPLDLPTVTVTASRDLPPPEAWRYAVIEGFEVLSGVSDGATDRILRDFLKFRQALQIVWPALVPPATASSLVLCDGQEKFGDFIPGGKASGYSGTAGHFLRDREQTAIVIDLNATTISHPAQAGLVMPNAGSAGSVTLVLEPHAQLHREYIRLLLASRGSPPAWLVEGISQIVADMEMTDRWIICGRIDETKGALTLAGGMLAPEGGIEKGSLSLYDFEFGDRPFNAALHRRALIPLDKFFTVAAETPSANEPAGTTLWAKQAYAFVHMCLFRADAKFEKPFALFLQRLAVEPLSEKLFLECFNLTYQEMSGELRGYIDHTLHKYRTYALDPDNRLRAGKVTTREATQGEIGRIKGDAQRMAGRHADALASYRVAYARGERDLLLLGALGVAEQHTGQTDRARELLEAAARLGSQRPSVYTTLARLRLDEAKAKPAADAGKLSAGQVTGVFGLLLKARALPPALPETYEVMAEAWMLSAVPPTPGHVDLVGEGAMQFPSRIELVFRTAELYARAGDPHNAGEVARMGVRFAADESARARLERFAAALPPPAVSLPVSAP